MPRGIGRRWGVTCPALSCSSPSAATGARRHSDGRTAPSQLVHAPPVAVGAGESPPGSFIAAYFWDIESGGLDLEARGHGSAHEREHALDGWNIGPAPYGYQADRVPHPVPVKAAQGRTKTRLVPDPTRAPVVAQIFTRRTENRLGVPEITDRLNADHDTYPASNQATGWTASGVASILSNPKHTGHMVFGRRRTQAGKRGQPVPEDQWLWTPEPVHPAIVTRATWDTAQRIGAQHGTSPDGLTAQAPGHPATVSVREDLLIETIRQFFATQFFGTDRATHLARQLPAGAAEEAARREKQATRLRKRLKQIDTTEDAHIREVQALADLDPNSAAVTAMRTRHLARFTELEAERDDINSKLAALAKQATQTTGGDPALLNRLPMLGNMLAAAPDRIKQQLFDAFDIQALWATITPSTPAAPAAIIAATETPELAAPLTTQDHVSDLASQPEWAISP